MPMFRSLVRLEERLFQFTQDRISGGKVSVYQNLPIQKMKKEHSVALEFNAGPLLPYTKPGIGSSSM